MKVLVNISEETKTWRWYFVDEEDKPIWLDVPLKLRLVHE